MQAAGNTRRAPYARLRQRGRQPEIFPQIRIDESGTLRVLYYV